MQDKPRDWQPLVYCWRGGKRSGTLAWFLDQIGFRTTLRARRLQGLSRTGARAAGDAAAALRLRRHRRAHRQRQDTPAAGAGRGRRAGARPRRPGPAPRLGARWPAASSRSRRRRPSRPRSGTALSAFDPSRPVYVESESRKIGQLQVPTALLERMRSDGRVVMVTMPDEARVQLLLEEYGFFAEQLERFCGHLDTLVELRGRDTVQALAGAGARRPLGRGVRRADALPLRPAVPEVDAPQLRRGGGRASEVPLRDGGAATLREAADAIATDRAA